MEIAEVNQHIATNMRYLRRKYRMTQAALAKQVGIGIGSLRRLEAGDIPHRFRCHSICRICDIFNISADELLLQDIESLNNAIR